jgi:hypothetical protein
LTSDRPVVEIAIVLVLSVTLAAALASWRIGLLVTIAIGFLQDPLRKVTEHEPVFLTGLVALSFAVVLLVAAVQGILPRPWLVYGWAGWFRRPVLSFLVLIVAQAMHTLVRFGTPTLALIGLGGYLTPIPAAWIGYRYARNVDRVRTFLLLYALLAATVSSGVLLSFLGYDWSVLRQVGSGLVVFSQGMRLEVHPGFWRSPEVAAWHAAAAVCYLVLLWTLTRQIAGKALIAGLIAYLLGVGALTGRRKMLVETVVFVAVYGALLLYSRRGAPRLAGLAVAVGIVGAVLTLDVIEQPWGQFDAYLRHGTSGFVDAPQRLQVLGLGSVGWAIRRHGVLGVGAGAGTQGAQHFGGGSMLVGGTAEGGLGRVATELGLPGLLVLGWFTVAVGHLTWRSMRSRLDVSGQDAAVKCGLAAFLAANAVTFLVASQVYGDLFVQLLLGWTLGLLVASLRERRWSVVVPRLLSNSNLKRTRDRDSRNMLA